MRQEFSCSLQLAHQIPFTQAVRDQYKLTPEELKGIQFYLSIPLLYEKGEANENQKSTEDGKLIIESGKTIDQVTIKIKYGRCRKCSDLKSLTVSFEEGAEKYLVFSSIKSRNGFYSLQALNWENGRGKVSYAGQTWYASPGSDQAILLFKMKSIKKLRVNEKVAKGRKVN
ncbi:MAG: hypothetical protein IPM91_11410 [Bacteroidetes bacterium]|nr:hypothetical protein [Bacteroidota bacterium]